MAQKTWRPLDFRPPVNILAASRTPNSLEGDLEGYYRTAERVHFKTSGPREYESLTLYQSCLALTRYQMQFAHHVLLQTGLIINLKLFTKNYY